MREFDDGGGFIPDPEEIFVLSGEHTLTQLAAYFGQYGDVIQERVAECLEDAKTLLGSGHHSAAVLRAFTAAELMVSHFVVRPLMSAVLMSEDIAQALTEAAFRRSSETERKLIPSILKHWMIGVDDIRLPDGTPVWAALVNQVRPLRNAIAHGGKCASAEDATLSVEAVAAFREHVVRLIGRRLGFFVRSERWSDSSCYRYERKRPRFWDV